MFPVLQQDVAYKDTVKMATFPQVSIKSLRLESKNGPSDKKLYTDFCAIC